MDVRRMMATLVLAAGSAACAPQPPWLAENVLHDDARFAEPVVGVAGHEPPFHVFVVEPAAVPVVLPSGRTVMIVNRDRRYVFDAEPVHLPSAAAAGGVAQVPATAPIYVYAGVPIDVVLAPPAEVAGWIDPGDGR